MKYLSRLLPLVLLLLVGIAFVPQKADIYFLIKKNFSIFSKSYENVALEYVDQVDPEMLMRTGLDAMMETLDPYTAVYNESQNEQAEILSRGNYAGIGIEAGYRDGEIVIIAPTEGGPADRKGMRAGDVIIAVDGVSTESLQPEEAQILTVGEVGSSVVITIKRFGVDQPLDFELVRERIEIPNVTHSGLIGDNEDVGYIRLAQFGERSAEEVRVAMKELMDEKELEGLVLDLRDNPGGILQEAVAIIDKFVEPGLTVVENRGRIAEYNQIFQTREPVMFDKPVLVLMNGGSASAAEVVAGALQDLDRAVVVGEQSFGKGLVQIVKPLPYNTSMKITIARYYIPSGRSIQSIDYTHQGRNSGVAKSKQAGKVFKTRNGREVFEGRGIEPDVEVPLGEPSLLQIALLQKGSYFDFATRFQGENAGLDFEQFPQNIFTDFKIFLEESDFNYTTDSEELLVTLGQQMSDSEEVSESIDEIRSIIEQEKKLLLEQERDQIEQKLFEEILYRFKGQKARTIASLKTDKQVNEVLTLINNPNRIEAILGNN